MDADPLACAMEATVSTTLEAFAAQAITVFVFYPYRDFIKHSQLNGVVQPDAHFFFSRYRGMALHPSQPLILSLPTTLLFGTYRAVVDATHSVTLAAVLGASAGSVVKQLTAIQARRMGQQKSFLHGAAYSSMVDCLRRSTALLGVYSWFAGFSAVWAAQVVWLSVAVLSLCRLPRQQVSFSEDMYFAVRAHCFGAFLSAPIRNALRGSQAHARRLDSLAAWASHEKGSWKEALAVSGRMMKDQGPRYFFRGTPKVVLMTTVPWSFMFATFRAFGGTLAPPTGGHWRHA